MLITPNLNADNFEDHSPIRSISDLTPNNNSFSKYLYKMKTWVNNECFLYVNVKETAKMPFPEVLSSAKYEKGLVMSDIQIWKCDPNLRINL